MANQDNIISVSGYAQKVFYNDGIEYRNFTPDLVGNQFADDKNRPLFTYGNFAVTLNAEGRTIINYPSKPFGKFFNLNDITAPTNGSNSTSSNSGGSSNTNETVNLIFNSDIKIKLNIDTTDISNFAYFGSTTEFIRVSLENIITKWPASIFVKPLDNKLYDAVATVENYSYDSYYKTSKFKIKNNTFVNNFDVIYNIGGTSLISYDNELQSLVSNYVDYVVLVNDVEYPLIEFTGSTLLYGDYVYLRVNGNPFPDALNGPLYINYHIKPNNLMVEKFFMGLAPFENTLLNRLTLPKYKSTFSYKYITDEGIIYDTSKSIVWPTTDGYNLDFNTTEYIDYANELLLIADSLDDTKSDLMVRFLVAESISNFDTVPRCDGTEEETAGQKMTKTLRVYGREFDEIKQYIDGLSYANTVTYDKFNNAPDQMIKYIARVMGWELTSSILENDLIKSYLTAPAPTYSGYTRGLTPAEAELELWRRLILNSAWLFKSKGTRKAIEFLFKFINVPEGLINLNEYIYAAKEKIDTGLFTDTLLNYNYNPNLSNYNVDYDGYPNPLPNSVGMYFQKGGLWYRETGGQNASVYKTDGNNPHIGPYDGGAEYINQFRNLLPDFKPTVLTSSTYTYSTTELFKNYNNGLINKYTGNTYVGIETWSGVSLDDCFLYKGDIIHDPHPTSEVTDCGCDLPTDDLSLFIDVKRDEYTESEKFADCKTRISGYTFIDTKQKEFYNKPFIYNWNYITYNVDGTPTNKYYVSPYISPVCCKVMVKGESYLHDEYTINPDTGKPTLVNSGYVCCKKQATVISDKPVDKFETFGYSNQTSTASPVVRPRNMSLGYDVERSSSVCGCYIACKWRLVGPLLGQMYGFNNDSYLKFVTPKNDWGQSGTPEYRVTTESDACFCPPKITTPELINDPYTNKKGYACKLNNEGKKLLTLSQLDNTYGTINGPLYQIFYKRSIGEIACTSTSFENKCKIKAELITSFKNNNGVLYILPPNVYGANGNVTYFWEITTQTGIYSNHILLNSQTSQVIQIGPINGQTYSGNGELKVKLTITDSSGCKTTTTGSYIRTDKTP